MPKKWYTDRYRRHLCDMHIDGWNESFLSQFSPEEYIENLRTAKVNAPMLYLQSFVGYCYYPTKCGVMHPAFESDPGKMRRLVDLCHENGMTVVGYYTLIHNTWAHDTHPEWRMLDANGRSDRVNTLNRYGFCCPNNPDYRSFVFEQIREMLDYFPVEGMFYDMPFWPKVCYCNHCKARWAKEVGGEIPLDPTDPRWETLLARRREWIGEFSQAVTDCTKSIRPEVSVEQNYANAVEHRSIYSISDEVNNACDYTGGDLYGGFFEQSFTCKYYMSATANPPFEYMTCRCSPDLFTHTLTKTRRELEMAVLITCAHHGASLLIDAVDPVGTMNRRVYELMGNAYSLQIPYEKYFSGKMLEDVAVIYDLPSKANRHGQDFNNHHCALQAVISLTRRHIPVGVATYRQMSGLDRYPVLVAPLMHSLKPEYVDALVHYVENGGRLYFSGAEQPELVRRLLGAEVEGFTEHTVTYLVPEKGMEEVFGEFDEIYPLPYDSCAPVLKDFAGDAQVLARVKLPYTVRGNGTFASIHSDPPGIMTDHPAVIRRKVGAGEVVWCGMAIEKESLPDYGRIFVNLLGLLGLKPRVQTDAPSVAEVVVFEDGSRTLVSAVRLSDEYDRVLPGFEVKVFVGKAPARVVHLPDEGDVEFSYADGWVKFEVEKLDLIEMFAVEM